MSRHGDPTTPLPEVSTIETCAASLGRFWSATAGTELEVLEGFRMSGLSLAFAPDSKAALVASLDGRAPLVDLASRVVMNVLRKPNDIDSVSISSSGTLALTVSEGYVSVWRMFPRVADLINEARTLAPRTLTDAQRQSLRVSRWRRNHDASILRTRRSTIWYPNVT